MTKINIEKIEKELYLMLNHTAHKMKICRFEQFVKHNNATTVLVYTKDGYYEALFDGFLYLLKSAEKHKLVPEYPSEWWKKLCKMYPSQTFFKEHITIRALLQ